MHQFRHYKFSLHLSISAKMRYLCNTVKLVIYGHPMGKINLAVNYRLAFREGAGAS